MNSKTRAQTLSRALGLALLLAAAGSAAAAGSGGAQLDAAAFRVVSDEDQANVQHIKYQIANDYSDFKSLDEVHSFLEKLRLLVQKHPRNTAFAQGDLRELHKFLSQELVARLIRVDSDQFAAPMTDERLALAQRAADDDELSRKLFGAPLRALAEAKRQQLARADEGNHRDGNFFANFWCKISGGCTNQ